VLTKPTVQVLSALATLEGNADYETVRGWLQESLNQVRQTNDSTKEEVLTRWNQGAAQALGQFLETSKTARETLYKKR